MSYLGDALQWFHVSYIGSCRNLKSSNFCIQYLIVTLTNHIITLKKNSEAETKDRALQQRVRRLHSKLEKGIINTETFADVEKEAEGHVPLGLKACEFLTKSTDPFLAVKTCSDTLDAAGFVKLSKREPFGGKLVPGEFG